MRFKLFSLGTTVVFLRSGAGSRPAATRFLLSCQKKPGKENARLAGSYPAELAALLRRSARTTAGNQNFYLKRARRLRAHGVTLRLLQKIRLISQLLHFYSFRRSCQKRSMQISFTGQYARNPANFGINFQALVDGKSFTCSVTVEALQDVDPSNVQSSPEQQFLDNRAIFESIATQKILGGENSPMLITSSDVFA